eukprot:gene8796-6182_t
MMAQAERKDKKKKEESEKPNYFLMENIGIPKKDEKPPSKGPSSSPSHHAEVCGVRSVSPVVGFSIHLFCFLEPTEKKEGREGGVCVGEESDYTIH